MMDDPLLLLYKNKRGWDGDIYFVYQLSSTNSTNKEVHAMLGQVGVYRLYID